MNNQKDKKLLDNEIQKLIVNKWYFLDYEWPILTPRFNHRSEIKPTKINLREIKDILFRQLGYIPVFYFLVILFGAGEYPGPYHEIDKGIILLYHIMSGKTGMDMYQFIPYTSFYEVYKKFWITNRTKVNKIIKKDNQSLFSNIKIRLLSANLFNPDGFKNCTLFIDGHDSKIKYYNPDVGRNTLYSHKFKRPGVRTQTVNDVNNMVIWVSNSERCSMGNDGSMFIKMNMHKKMHIADCLAADGGYTLFIQKFKDISCEEGYDFSNKNMSCPIRKDTGKKMTVDEESYNRKFGAFRSGNESIYSNLAFKFDRFNNNKASVQVSDINVYNTQFKTAVLLMNMWRFIENANIEAQPHHMLWYNDDFEFPTKVSRINYVFLDKAKNDENYNEMIDLQEKYRNMNFDDNDIEIEDDSEGEEIGELKHKSFKKLKSVVIE